MRGVVMYGAVGLSAILAAKQLGAKGSIPRPVG
ncbi:hypothetical protein ACVWYS_002048 [Arthrobacter sp. TE12231]